MYKIEIQQSEESWVVAISPDKNRIDEYLLALPDDLRILTTTEVIPPQAFPLVMLEYHEPLEGAVSRFEFCSLEALERRMEVLRKQKTSDGEHVYFRYYFFEEEYMQDFPSENSLRYRTHTAVTNAVLDEPYKISVFHEQIKKYVSNYDVESLDMLFGQTQTLYTSSLEREDLAINGYESLFWEMNYDYACGKLTDVGIDYLIPMVDAMETLLGNKKWQHRSHALHIVLENACKKKSSRAISLLQNTVNAFEQYLLSIPQETPDIHRMQAQAYQWMMEADTVNALSYWQQAVSEIQKAIEFSPQRAPWSSLLELVYVPCGLDKRIQAAQVEAQQKFVKTAVDLEQKLGPEIAYRIAQAYQHLREYWEWKKIEKAFPEEAALGWTEKSLAYEPPQISRIELHECTQFYHRIGSEKQRLDFLEKTIGLYKRMLTAVDDNVLEVYYICNVLKEIAGIHLKKKNIILADQVMQEAQQLYRQYNPAIRSNPSVYLRYAEFLEYCFFAYPGNIEKPTLAELKQVADEVEVQSEGFLSYPYLLLIKISLYENNEAQAVLELTKSLILHELCAETEYEKLWEEYKSTAFHLLKKQLQEVLQLEKEVGENYYYNPELTWQKMRTMAADELMAYWENRKKEIRNRPIHLTD
jgi:hypothetical protein